MSPCIRKSIAVWWYIAQLSITVLCSHCTRTPGLFPVWRGDREGISSLFWYSCYGNGATTRGRFNEARRRHILPHHIQTPSCILDSTRYSRGCRFSWMKTRDTSAIHAQPFATCLFMHSELCSALLYGEGAQFLIRWGELHEVNKYSILLRLFPLVLLALGNIF